MNNREKMQKAFEVCERYAGRDFTKTNGVYTNDGVQHEFRHFLEGYQAGLASQAQQTKPHKQDEYKKLARILADLCEGGAVESGVDIYADDYQAPDGDVYVNRAADLLIEQGIEIEMLTATINHLTSSQLQSQAQQEAVAEIVPCYVPSGKRAALYTQYQRLPIGTKLYAIPPAPEGA